MSMAGSCVDSSQYENKERKYNSNQNLFMLNCFVEFWPIWENFRLRRIIVQIHWKNNNQSILKYSHGKFLNNIESNRTFKVPSSGHKLVFMPSIILSRKTYIILIICLFIYYDSIFSTIITFQMARPAFMAHYDRNNHFLTKS